MYSLSRFHTFFLNFGDRILPAEIFLWLHDPSLQVFSLKIKQPFLYFYRLSAYQWVLHSDFFLNITRSYTSILLETFGDLMHAKRGMNAINGPIGANVNCSVTYLSKLESLWNTFVDDTKVEASRNALPLFMPQFVKLLCILWAFLFFVSNLSEDAWEHVDVRHLLIVKFKPIYCLLLKGKDLNIPLFVNPLRPFISRDAALWILSRWLVLPVKCGLFAWVGFSKCGLANKLSPFQWAGRFIMPPMQI